MPVLKQTTSAFVSGTHNLLDDEIIPQDAASESLNWMTRDGAIELVRGRSVYGNAGSSGKMYAEHTGYRADGTEVRFRKTGTKIQYYNAGTWTDVITGLTAADYTFANYSSLAGAFTYAFGIDGIFKICTANPASYTSLYDPSINFKGYATIDKGRTILWGREEDPTGLYGSWIDAQDSTVYTTVSAETLGSGDGADTTFNGTLAFKAVNEYRTAFGLQIYAPIASADTITAITKASKAQITATGHGLSVDDKVLIESVSGMTQINGLTLNVVEVVDADNFKVGVDSTDFSTYTSGGTATEVEVFTDDFNGVLTSNLGGTGTINYTTGAWDVTFNTAPVNASNNIKGTYQWENSNEKGVTDFTKSATRLAGEGFVLRQDAGGDAIKVVIPFDGSYFSLKQRSCYRLTIDATDENPVNEIFRTDIGVSTLRAAVGTSLGIVFVNTANPSRTDVQILQRNPLGDNFVATQLFAHYSFRDYVYDDVMVDSWDKYVIIACRENSEDNNILLLCDVVEKVVDKTYYDARCSAKLDGSLHVGSSVAETSYVLFEGFDDVGVAIDNEWLSKGETFGDDVLKKTKKLRFKGNIDPDQAVEIYVSYDDNDFELVGTILGSGAYVDYGVTYAIGTSIVGTNTVGGGILVNVYPYFMEIKLRNVPKFRKRMIKLVATGIGYVSVESITDFDIWIYQEKMPARYREKQNVNLAGTPIDEASP